MKESSKKKKGIMKDLSTILKYEIRDRIDIFQLFIGF